MLSIQDILAGNIPEANTASNPISYNCDKCQDVGMIFIEKDGYEFAKECDCIKAKRAKAIIEKSGLSKLLNDMTFERFSTYMDWQKKAVEYAREYVERVKSGGNRIPWFFIGGNPGCGKTHLCTAICGELLNAKIPVLYMQWITDARTLKSLVNEPDFDISIERFIDAPVLYIDDLFKQRAKNGLMVTDADIKVAFEILNARYIQDKPTIISSEWYLESDLLEADDATFSRVYERSKGFTISVKRMADNNFRLRD